MSVYTEQLIFFHSDPDDNECLYPLLPSAEKTEDADECNTWSSDTTSDSPIFSNMESAQFFGFEADGYVGKLFDVDPGQSTEDFMTDKYHTLYSKSGEPSNFSGEPINQYCNPSHGELMSNDFSALYQCAYEHEQLPSIGSIFNAAPIDITDKFDSMSVDSHQSLPQSPPLPSDSEKLKVTPQPRRRQHLWEFIINLLLDEKYNPDIIKWENRSMGVFRIVKSGKVAQLWGNFKKNARMTYEKMSRALRHTRKMGYLADLPQEHMYPRKLTFMLSPKAKGWNQ